MGDSLDPRPVVVTDRLAGVGRVIGVTGSKGGIGKSVIAATLALALADRGNKVGLFDLDFTSPSDHVVLGVDRRFPTEEFGVEPHRVHGIELMSVAFFAGDAAVPLRGAETTSALLELLAITNWGDLDILLLDMPPGLGDTSLDVINLVPRLEFLLVGNGSRVVIESVHKALALLTELEVPMVGLLENMQWGDGSAVTTMAQEFAIPYLGSIPFDPGLEDALGSVHKLRKIAVYRGLVTLSELLAAE
ncbi:MAG: P-loop NTPase [Acidimicrobiia bacterium]|nr:P-loop NTPase [Acidimicrobiia bacterium]